MNQHRQDYSIAVELIEALRQGVVILGVDGRFEYVNAAYARIAGRPASTLIGMRPEDVTHPDDLPALEHARQQRMAGNSSSYNTRLLQPDGSLDHVHVFSMPRHKYDRVVGSYAVVTDVANDSEQMETADALLQSQQQYREAAAAQLAELQAILAQAESVASIGSWKWELQSEKLTWSDGMFRLFGLEREQFDGDLARIIDTRIHPDDIGAVKDANRAVLQEHDPRPLEYRILLPNGSQRTVWAEGRLVLDTSGQPMALIGYVQDITAARRAEHALRESQTQLRHIVNTVPEGVLLLAPGGAIHLANPVARQHLDILAPGYRNGPLQRLGDHPLAELLAPPPQDLWHEIVLPDYVFEALARPVEVGDANAGWVLVLRDVTRERQTRERAQQQERLAAIGQIAAGIAHDFNNILAVFTLYSQLLARDMEIPPAAQEKLATMQQQAQRASHLIQQILDFSRQSVLERVPLDLLPFMQEIKQLFERTLPEDIHLSLNYHGDAYFVTGDPTRLQEVMMNLGINARDAMPEGGRLQISLSHIATTSVDAPLPEMSPGEWVVIEVSDSGAGIPRHILPRLFEPFFTTKPIGKGTGLGLSQVYGIIQQLDGYIDVDSSPDAGTTFTLYLPGLPAPKGGDTIALEETLEYGQGQQILLVEDDASTRQALANSLKFLKYQVVTAEDGQQALEILCQQDTEIRAVLSDVVMPRMGGVVLYQAVRRLHPPIPFVLISGHPLDTKIDAKATSGIAGILSKPVDLAQLSRTLTGLFSADH